MNALVSVEEIWNAIFMNFKITKRDYSLNKK